MKWKSSFSQKDFHLNEPSSYGKNIKEKGKLLKDMKENFENQDIQIIETKKRDGSLAD